MLVLVYDVKILMFHWITGSLMKDNIIYWSPYAEIHHLTVHGFLSVFWFPPPVKLIAMI